MATTEPCRMHHSHSLRLSPSSSSGSKGLTSSTLTELDINEKHDIRKDQAPSSDDDFHSQYSDEDDPSAGSISPMTFHDKSKPSRPKPKINTNHSRSHSSSSPMSPTTRAWYEFDLAVVVALVSPVGNWLTGGDHVKNILIIILLIFYLHQIIEGERLNPNPFLYNLTYLISQNKVPWQLYQKSRPRQRAPNYPSHNPGPETAASHYASLARSELRAIEFFFLALASLSPLIGAFLLRYVTVSFVGDSVTVSWFSTGLFVLATGIRPWSHIVERVVQRTGDLHTVVHYPPSPIPPSSNSDSHSLEDLTKAHKRELGAVKAGIGELERRVERLGKALEKVRVGMVEGVEGVYAYVDEAVEEVGRGVKRGERVVGKWEERVRNVESAVGEMRGLAGEMGKEKENVRWSLFWVVPSWFPFSTHVAPVSRPEPLSTNVTPNQCTPTIPSPSRSFRSLSSLETILEEADANTNIDTSTRTHKNTKNGKRRTNNVKNSAYTHRRDADDAEEVERQLQPQSPSSSSLHSSEEEPTLTPSVSRNLTRNQKYPPHIMKNPPMPWMVSSLVYAATFPLRVLGRVLWVLRGG